MSSSAASSSDGDDIPATADPSDKGSDSEVEINDEDDDGGSVEVEGEEEGEEEDDDGEREEEGDDGEGEGGEGEGEGEGEREGEEEDGEEEAEDDDGEDKAIDLLDSPVAAYEGQKDSSQEIESDGHDEHLRSGSSAPEKSELNIPADACDKEDNGFPESAVDNKDTEALPEEKAPDVQKDHHEAHNGSEAHLNNSDSMDAHNTRSSSVNEKVVAAEALMGNGSSHKGSNSVIHSESKQMEMQEGEDLNMRASSLPTPQQRPRSLSPGADYEDRNKRPAIVCDFFARGWCIKGSSCRFLHRKDGMEKGDVAVTNWKSKLQVDAGLRQGTETSRLSTFPEPLASSVAINSSFMSHLPSGSFLSLEHGESHRLHQFHQEHRPPSLRRGDPSSAILQDKSGPTSIIPRDFQQLSSTGDDRRPIFSFKDVGRENLRQNLCLDDFSRHASSVIQGNFSKLDTHGRGWPANNFEKWTSSIQEEYSQKPLSDLMGNKLSVTEEFMSGSPLARSDFVPNYRFLSSGSIASSSIYKSSSNPSVYNKSVEEQASLKSNSNTSLPSIGLSPSRHTLVWSGGSSSHVSSSLSALDGDRGYHGSRSTSLPRSSSSPFYSRSEPENLPLHSVPRDSLASAGQKTQSNVNAWEPSLPFRPSFHFASGSISSPGSQYDPLVDSIDPPNGGDRSFRASSFGQGATIQLTSHQQTNGDPVLTGTCGPEYNADKNSLSFNQQSRGNAMEKNIVIHGVGLCMPAGETTGTCVDDHENKGSTAKDEKPLDPGDFVDVAKANEMGLDHNSRHQRDRARHKKEPEEGGGRYNSEMDLHRKFRHQKDGEGHNKESKALKLFRADLVDFVKELVKPHWREGHLSKDAHKTVVRKAVDKVLSALQPSQVPSTSESINQYLSSSRAKIARLVEGYVDKYAKSSAASG